MLNESSPRSRGVVKSLKPDPNWISSISGTFKDDPEFDEVLDLGRNSAMLMRSTYGLNISRSTSSTAVAVPPLIRPSFATSRDRSTVRI